LWAKVIKSFLKNCSIRGGHVFSATRPIPHLGPTFSIIRKGYIIKFNNKNVLMKYSLQIFYYNEKNNLCDFVCAHINRLRLKDSIQYVANYLATNYLGFGNPIKGTKLTTG
jgi:hypothetical protein